MWNGTASAEFEAARERESELNDRQRRILDLIERGHTNREIADILAISVDGAKWNVSEILTKLGLSSREAAADYWHWRQGRAQPLRRLLRGMLGLPGAKWAAGGAAATAVGGFALLVAFGSNPARSADPEPDRFYLEAVAHRADPEHPTDHEFRWWHYDESQAKWSWDLVGPAIQTTHRTSFQDGETLYTYSPDGGPLSIQNGWSNGTRYPRPDDVILIGPAEQRSIQELVTWLSSWGDGQTAAEVTGNEQVGNWNAVVIKYVSGTMWVEPNEMLIVKHVSDSMTMVLRAFSRAELPRSDVALPSTVAARPTPTAVDFSQPWRPDLIPVLVPTYEPWSSELQVRYSFGGRYDGVTEQILMSSEQMMANQHTPGTPARNGPHILLQQRTGLAAMPLPMQAGFRILVRGGSGYLQEQGGIVTLNWQEPDGRLVHMEGVDVSLDEVRKVAEGLRLSSP